ncbi:MAG: M48 family metallopeptidase [Rhodobacteraceae bacterium]|nr:M48 family metallopeptidase [Paracoccaceae bacterium]
MAEQHLLAGNPPIEIHLRQNPRAKRLTLRVSARDGRVLLTVPRGVSERAAMEFAASKEAWLRRHVGKVSDRPAVAIGATVPVEGREVMLAVGAVRAPRLEGDTLRLPRRAEAAPGRAVAGFLKVLARERLVPACDFYARQLGVRFTKISLRDTRSRWGSCSTTGGLNFSWRLAMAPPAALRYVAAHEVSHLVEMNHSPAFWAIVERLDPNFRAHTQWLKANGSGLQSIILD